MLLRFCRAITKKDHDSVMINPTFMKPLNPADAMAFRTRFCRRDKFVENWCLMVGMGISFPWWLMRVKWNIFDDLKNGKYFFKKGARAIEYNNIHRLFLYEDVGKSLLSGRVWGKFITNYIRYLYCWLTKKYNSKHLTLALTLPSWYFPTRYYQHPF